MAVLRADSAAGAAQRAFLQAQADSQHAATLDAQARLAEQVRQLAVLRRVSQGALAGLDSARSAADSLLRYPVVVHALTSEVAELRSSLDSSLALIRDQNRDYGALERLLTATDAQRLNAEARASSLGKLNQDLARELAHARTNLWPRLKWSAGTAVLGAAAVCLATTIC